MSGEERLVPTESLDLRGVPCPTNFARTLLRLEVMGPGDILEILLDGGEPIENVPPALEDEGHEILERDPVPPLGAGWRLMIRRQ